MSIKIADQDEQWSKEYLGEELFQRLASFKIRKGTEPAISFYSEQARYLMYRIPVYNPIPSFIIKWYHLTSKIQKEIIKLQKEYSLEEFEETIVESVGRLFEILNPRYYYGSVRQYLKVKFIK